MTELTSTVLTSLLVTAIGAMDSDLSRDSTRPDPMDQALISGSGKRTVLSQLQERNGAGAPLMVGQYLHLAEETPVLAVLLKSTDPRVLAEKWMRLEQYHHSHHRTRIDATMAGQWLCRRESHQAPPGVAENYLIAGVLLGFLEAIGAKNCRLQIDSREIAKAEFRAVSPADGRLDTFAIVWSEDGTGTPPKPESYPDRPLNDQLADHLAHDIGRGWRLADAARGLAYSERSLQRHLKATGRSFSSVLRRARMREASRLLTETDTSIAEIGYCCGYADQAHFQRDFLRVTNMTPKVFRDVMATDETAAESN
ncbi:helix-turn-helix transcriptional regulator [Hyphomonas sp.]|uniref:helix-turn-helix transcriptional regulator n=1 Tax=Hyphomonas sp. TaxID=87 RepID=UPI003527D78A